MCHPWNWRNSDEIQVFLHAQILLTPSTPPLFSFPKAMSFKLEVDPQTLPRSSEWEKRGGGGGIQNKYPWACRQAIPLAFFKKSSSANGGNIFLPNRRWRSMRRGDRTRQNEMEMGECMDVAWRRLFGAGVWLDEGGRWCEVGGGREDER